MGLKPEKVLRGAKGRGPISRFLYPYEVGDKVVVSIDPSIIRGAPNRKYHGKVGTIVEKRGKAFCIAIREGGKVRLILVNRAHMRPHSSL